MRCPLSRRDACRGFSLTEVLLIGVVAVIFWYGYVQFLATLVKAEHPGDADIGGAIFPIAPSFPETWQAIRLHDHLIDDISQASAVYVLGGYGQDPDDPTAPQGTILEAAMGTNYAGLASVSPDGFASGLQLKETLLAKGALWTYKAPTYAPLGSKCEDFTVVCLSAGSAILSMTQCQTYRSGGYYGFRVVRAADGQSEEYRFAIAQDLVSAASLPGAYHQWVQLTPEAIPAPQIVRFPDPYMGIEPGVQFKTRFHYVLPVRR